MHRPRQRSFLKAVTAVTDKVDEVNHFVSERTPQVYAALSTFVLVPMTLGYIEANPARVILPLGGLVVSGTVIARQRFHAWRLRRKHRDLNW